MRAFFTFCFRSDLLPPLFTAEHMCAFFQWHVGGFDSVKHHAYTSCASFISAWRDHATHVGGYTFPGKKSIAILRVNRFINTLGRLFPHQAATGVELTLARIAAFAHYWQVNSMRAVEQLDLRPLGLYTRLLLAHSAMLRGCEHKHGMRISDIVDRGSHYSLTVGLRDNESKYKGRPRTVAIECVASHMSAGACLRVFLRRARRGAASISPLFPRILPSGSIRAGAGETFKTFKGVLARIAAVSGIVGVIGESSSRAGGATDAFAAGASDEWVRRQGGWRSDAFKRYNRPTLEQTRTLGREVCTAILCRSTLRQVSGKFTS